MRGLAKLCELIKKILQKPTKLLKNVSQDTFKICFMTIPVNKKRFPIVFLIGLIVSVLLIILIVDTVKHFHDKGYDNSIYLGAFIGLSIWILGLTIFAFLEFIKTMFDKSAMLTISDNGINDNLSIFSVGNINWTDISDIKITTVLKVNFLVIGVTDPQSFIDRKSKLKQRTLKSFLKKFGSPIVITQKRIDYDLTDLKEILLRTQPK